MRCSDLGHESAADALLPALTVDARLWYAANLSNPRSVSAAEKSARIRDAVQLLSLEPVRHRRIGLPLAAWHFRFDFQS